MYEALRHMNDKISEFSKSEAAFGRNIKKFTDLPAIITEFTNVPAQLDKNKLLLSAIDYQFEYLLSLIKEVQESGP
jgi:hypothetical protein